MRIQIPTVPRRRAALAAVVISGAIALVAAVTSVYEVELLPPKLEPRQLQVGAATTHALVDLPSSEPGHTAIDGLSDYDDVLALDERAAPLSQVMASPTVLARIGQRMDIDPGRISAATQIAESVPRSLIEPDSERRANQILAAADRYRLEIQARPGLPVLDIYAQGPSADQARRLADASIKALNSHLRDLATERGVPRSDRVRLTQLGAARSGAVDSTAPAMIAALTFLVVFGLSCGCLAVLAGIRRGWRQASSRVGAATVPVAAPTRSNRDQEQRDDWPHTSRVLPWMIAGFMALLWLVPFNSIALGISLPIDLKLDRLLLPVIVLVWVVALAAGGPSAPRWRLTPIHAGIAVFVAAAGLSVVLNAGELNQTLVLGLSIKKLSLLAAYVALFVVVASAVRPREVRAFLTFMLALSLICAVGMIWEYRFHFNVFYEGTLGLLPGFFEVPTVWGGVDDLGRLSVIGPTELGLEAVAILSMALPIALVRLLLAKRWRDRVVYGLAVCLLGGAMLATFRKSALVAPLAVGLTLAYFRPREALKLAPLGVVAIVVLAILSFDAFDSVAGQFDSDRLDVATVSDRVADYDAVRPDVLSHPAFGRGFGSYEHTYAPADNRILDSDLLLRVVEMGLVGLAAFLVMVVSVIAVAARVIRGGDPRRAPPALAIGAAAIAFLVLAALFDEWSFPHAVYVFLTLAGLLAAMVGPAEGDQPPSFRPALEVPSSETIEVPAATNGSSHVPAPV